MKEVSQNKLFLEQSKGKFPLQKLIMWESDVRDRGRGEKDKYYS
jgi:hypothetical protein